MTNMNKKVLFLLAGDAGSATGEDGWVGKAARVLRAAGVEVEEAVIAGDYDGVLDRLAADVLPIVIKRG